MFTLIKGATVYGPDLLGKKDILMAADKIVAVAEDISLPDSLDAETVPAYDRIATPGFVDLHVHLTGGGGEGGPQTRVPEIQLSLITCAGVTTVLGVLGTDNITRHPESLLAKAMGLEAEGITAYIMSGSYQLPPVTITGSVKKDIALISQVVGVGEIAISDHRSSQPDFKEFVQLVAEARIGGMIGNKAGVVQLHMGHGSKGMDYLFRLAEETDIPVTQVFPTHVTKDADVLEHAIRFARMGGNVDITASGKKPRAGKVPTDDALRRLKSQGINPAQVTVSSDANGSLPRFDAGGNYIGMKAAHISTLLAEFKYLVVQDFGIPDIVGLFTRNPAERIKIDHRKGSIKTGWDADLLLFKPDWALDRVYAKGRLMVTNGRPLVFETFL
ncbi:MAG: beta-aspartyl-peptidase [Desulfobacteraceae bacterium]|nr:beta-aspartyl-peptidase [Desulfobacteraceae bacterium]